MAKYKKKLDADIRCPLEYGLAIFGGKSGGTAELLWLRPFYRDGAFLLYQGRKFKKSFVPAR